MFLRWLTLAASSIIILSCNPTTQSRSQQQAKMRDLSRYEKAGPYTIELKLDAQARQARGRYKRVSVESLATLRRGRRVTMRQTLIFGSAIVFAVLQSASFTCAVFVVSTRDSVVETSDDDGAILTRTCVNKDKEVYVMNAGGTNQVRLTNTLENEDSPVWSRNGTKLLFRSDRERECCVRWRRVWVMYADGSNQLNLSNSAFGDYGASW